MLGEIVSSVFFVIPVVSHEDRSELPPDSVPEKFHTCNAEEGLGLYIFLFRVPDQFSSKLVQQAVYLL